MRVDLTQDGNKDVDIELNGTKIENVLWADDATGECEVFETEWRTGELVKAPDTEWGYRTMRVKGKVKINDRRPKAPAGDTVYDFQYPGMCLVAVDPLACQIYLADSITRVFLGSLGTASANPADIVDAVMTLHDRVRFQQVYIGLWGSGEPVFRSLEAALKCPVLEWVP